MVVTIEMVLILMLLIKMVAVAVHHYHHGVSDVGQLIVRLGNLKKIICAPFKRGWSSPDVDLCH